MFDCLLCGFISGAAQSATVSRPSVESDCFAAAMLALPAWAMLKSLRTTGDGNAETNAPESSKVSWLEIEPPIETSSAFFVNQGSGFSCTIFNCTL